MIKDFIKDVKKISNVDMQKYKSQKNVKRSVKKQTITYDFIVMATDQDLDGFHIRGILISFFLKYAPNLIKEGKIRQLNTPLIVLKKKDKIVRYFMNFQDFNDFQRDNNIHEYIVEYKKGLGSWEKEELDELITKDGLDTFIEKLEWGPDLIKEVTQWFDTQEVESRKEKLYNNEFDILKI